jgi:hypothetical protein
MCLNMEIRGSMIKVFKQIIHGKNTLSLLTKTMKKSQSWISEVVSKLEQEEFITKNSNGQTISFEVASAEHARRLKDLMFERQSIRFEEILADKRILFLGTMCDDWISMDEVAKLSGISLRMISRYKAPLLNRGVLTKQKSLYKANGCSWPMLVSFLKAYKNHAHRNGYVKWKFQQQELFEVDDEKLIEGAVTGLASYKDYGVTVGIISALCFVPKRRISKEEIFVHSLFEVDDPRTLHLAMTFYLKNKLKKENVLPYALRYGKYTMFTNLLALFDKKELFVRLNNLPAFDRIDFYRIATMYDVKGLENPGEYPSRKRRGLPHVH